MGFFSPKYFQCEAHGYGGLTTYWSECRGHKVHFHTFSQGNKMYLKTSFSNISIKYKQNELNLVRSIKDKYSFSFLSS